MRRPGFGMLSIFGVGTVVALIVAAAGYGIAI